MLRGFSGESSPSWTAQGNEIWQGQGRGRMSFLTGFPRGEAVTTTGHLPVSSPWVGGLVLARVKYGRGSFGGRMMGW